MRVKDGGDPVRRKRKRKKLTQRELAFLARPCSQTTIYLIETGRMPTLTEDLAVRIAHRLDCDVEDLFEERSATRVALVTTGQRDNGSAA
jgi:DNA-binding XRE family transcriptional regulator